MALIITLLLPAPYAVALESQPSSSATNELPAPGTRIQTSKPYQPTNLIGMKINPNNPLKMEFLINMGDEGKEGSPQGSPNQRLINYFMAALTVPQDQLWVNLSPQEANRIIATELVKTEMGRDMLAMDYLLKQLMASLLYPEEGIGSKFWQRVHQKAHQQFGTTDIPTDTFNKIWIVPEHAHVHTQDNYVFIVNSELNVLLEEDYLKLPVHTAELPGDDDNWSQETKELIRQIIIPEIKKEINTGKQFANLRQIYHAMLLATWFKKNFHNSLVHQAYADRNLVAGIDLAAPDTKNRIYEKYLAAFRKGAFDYIREDLDPQTGMPIPRRYFSGGLKGYDQAMVSEIEPEDEFLNRLGQKPIVKQTVDLRLISSQTDEPAPPKQPIAILPVPDLNLMQRLRRAQIDYTLYREIAPGLERVGEGYTRRAWAIPEEYPNLVFKVVRTDGYQEPPSAFEAQQLSDLANTVGFDTMVVDGIELIRIPGIAPFRYVGNTVIQLRGESTSNTKHFAAIVALFEKLGIQWDLAQTRNQADQLKNIALYEESVNGQNILVARVTDLKGFMQSPGADQAVTADAQQQLDILFNSFGEQYPFLWHRLGEISNKVASLGQAQESKMDTPQLIKLLRTLRESVENIRRLPVMKDTESFAVQPHLSTHPKAIFYLTIDQLLSDLDVHIVHIQKLIAPQSFGEPPHAMASIGDSVLLLKSQIESVENSFRTLSQYSRYPIIISQTGYRIFVDILNRDLSSTDFQAGFLAKINNLGLRLEMPSVGMPTLQRIKEKLIEMRSELRESKMEPTTRGEVQTTRFDQLESEVISDVQNLLYVNERQQYPANSTNSHFVQSVVAATTRNVILDVFQATIETESIVVSDDSTVAAELHRLIDGVSLIERRLEELHRRTDYLFVQDDVSGLITARLDVPVKFIDQAVLADFDSNLSQIFRTFNRNIMLPTKNLMDAADIIRANTTLKRQVLSEVQRTNILAQTDAVTRLVSGLRSRMEMYTIGVPRTESTQMDVRAIFQNSIRHQLARIENDVQRVTRELSESAQLDLVKASQQVQVTEQLSRSINHFVQLLNDVASQPRIWLIRDGDEIRIFDEFATFKSFTTEIRNAFGQQATRFRSKLQVVGSDGHELGKIESLIQDLESINRRGLFSEPVAPQVTAADFRAKRSEILSQIEAWDRNLSEDTAASPKEQEELIRQIVRSTVSYYLRSRIAPLLMEDINVTSMEYRIDHIQQLTLQFSLLKERLGMLANNANLIFIRDTDSPTLRAGIDPSDMLDESSRLQFQFGEYAHESRETFTTLGQSIEALSDIVENTNRWLTIDQSIDLIERILFHLAEARAAPSMRVAAEIIRLNDNDDEPMRVMYNTISSAIGDMESHASLMAMVLRDPIDETAPDMSYALQQKLNALQGMIQTLAQRGTVPLLRTEEGKIVFEQALTVGLSAEDLQRGFQWEAVRLGTNMVTLGARRETLFGKLNENLAQLQQGLDAWDESNLLGFYAFGALFGDLQTAILADLDEVSSQNFTDLPGQIENKQDLARSIVLNTVEQMVIGRIRARVDTLPYMQHGFTLKSEAETYIGHIRQEMTLAVNRINSLSRQANYAFQRHEISGEVSLDLGLIEANGTDQAALSDSFLDLHFKTMETLGENPAYTFTDVEVDNLMYWLDSGAAGLLPDPRLWQKLVHKINSLYQHSAASAGIGHAWVRLLAGHFDIEPKRLKNVFRWFKFVDVDITDVAIEDFMDFFTTVIEMGRKYPEIFPSFTYYVPPDISNTEKIVFARENMKTMTSMFSKDFIKRKTVLKAKIPGRDYYVGMEFGVPENGYGLNLVLGKEDASEETTDEGPFPNVFMRIGIDTQGPDMRINFMQGVPGKEEIINDEFVRLMGFHPAIALLYVALDLAHQGHAEIINGKINPRVDPFRVLHGIRPEFIPSMKHWKSKASINIMKGFDDFGLRKKTEFSRWRNVTEMVRVLIPQRMSQKDIKASSIRRIHTAFQKMKEIPMPDQAQLSDAQQIAVLELASADALRFVLSNQPYHPDIMMILTRLNLDYSYFEAIRELVALKADEGILGIRFDDQVGQATGAEFMQDQAMTVMTPLKRIAVLELAAEQFGMGVEYLNISSILRNTQLPDHMAGIVYDVIMDGARRGVFDIEDFDSLRNSDKALLSSETKGGIDFNPKNAFINYSGNLTESNSNVGTSPEIPPIQGIVPVLIQLSPVTNLPLLLGGKINLPQDNPDSTDAATIKIIGTDPRLSFLR